MKSITVFFALFGAWSSLAWASSPVVTVFPVTTKATLFITSNIRWIAGPDSFSAVPGTYSASYETTEGVFFLSSQGLNIGTEKDPKWKQGGVFIPKDFSKRNRAYFFTGKPPSVDKKCDFWHNLYVAEGVDWHIDAGTTPEPQIANWENLVRKWVQEYDGDTWTLVAATSPRYRYSLPAGWLSVLELIPKSKSGEIGASYPRVRVALILGKEKILWYTEIDRETKTGNFIVRTPPQMLWTDVRAGAP